MSIARQRSIRKIAAFRERYFAEHVDATWSDAGLAYVMQARRQRVGEASERPESHPPVQRDYASFVETARAFVESEAGATRRSRVPTVSVPAWLRPALGS
jgi:hypothetical protein